MKINEIIIREEDLSPQAVQTYAASLYQAGRSREAVLTLQVATDPKFNNSIDNIQGEVARRISAMPDYKPASKTEYDSALKQYTFAFGKKRDTAEPTAKPTVDQPRQRGGQIGNQNAYKGGPRGTSFRDLAKSAIDKYSIDTRSLGTAATSGVAIGQGLNRSLNQYTSRTSK